MSFCFGGWLDNGIVFVGYFVVEFEFEVMVRWILNSNGDGGGSYICIEEYFVVGG